MTNNEKIKLNLRFEEDIYIFSEDIKAQTEKIQKYSHGGEYANYERLTGKDFFGNDKPFNIEIGIGNGEFLSEYAKKNQDQNYLGFEVMKKIFRRAITKAKHVESKNIRLLHFDATFFVSILEDNCVDNFYVNFPDPWPKKKHKKRRILKTEFIELLVRKLKQEGTLCMATDQIDYAEEIVENLKPVAALESVYDTIYIKELDDYIPTKYYRKFVPELGVHFFRLRKIAEQK
ncbi:tRNA (guanine-N(7)-)-methyltransferase [Denitrovibrio acetiphilus DSM 12809]|uniref:tRNA (guanine-N(7)-)-methyltransferase n=1 Tax=Denitrovibrio acetiphilus (strain DSM 12809 / NBRC 114555 / N2460) TaxID=522772 RepID=D4H3Z9_DENA2|nr:tRNA (guanosine(46)-N7)-methyltransferase TrmB [Denitrovibrio acetiphilus]ADD67310.1 tRNA (guanine-N(7)-)-methyltransferase [Denitrovibrio acetiphilus DSM 12809]